MSENNSSSIGSYVVVAAISAAVGAGIALLYAPHTGKVTRKMLIRKGRAFKDAAEDTYEDAMDFIEEKKAEFQKAIESRIDDLKEGMANTTAKAKKSA